MVLQPSFDGLFLHVSGELCVCLPFLQSLLPLKECFSGMFLKNKRESHVWSHLSDMHISNYILDCTGRRSCKSVIGDLIAGFKAAYLYTCKWGTVFWGLVCVLCLLHLWSKARRHAVLNCMQQEFAVASIMGTFCHRLHKLLQKQAKLNQK